MSSISTPAPSSYKSSDQSPYKASAFFRTQCRKHLFILIFSMIIGLFCKTPDESPWIPAMRVSLIVVIFYLISKFTIRSDRKGILETFILSFSAISVTYFFVTCPLNYFAFVIMSCVTIAITNHFRK